jgi:hypothetical protein
MPDFSRGTLFALHQAGLFGGHCSPFIRTDCSRGTFSPFIRPSFSGDIILPSSDRPSPRGKPGAADRPSNDFAAKSLPCVISPWPALGLPRVPGRKINFAVPSGSLRSPSNGRCPAGVEGLSFLPPWMCPERKQSIGGCSHNPSVSFADSSRLEGGLQPD